MKRILIALLIIIVAAGIWLVATRKKEPVISGNEVKVIVRSQVPSSPDDPAWEEAPLHPAKLILQDIVEPRLMTPSTQQVSAQAISDGRGVAFLLQWDDATVNNLPVSARFADACAVQLPAKISADVPAPQMGEPGRTVEISYWSASLQATVDGRGDEIRALYPQAAVDHYPFQAPSLQQGSPEQQDMEKRYAPARALGNEMSGPRKQPVQDLIAEGPGTLQPAERTISTGSGKRGENGWRVLITRPLPEGLSPQVSGQIAFAIWEGSKDEVGSRKMRTAWIPLVMEAKK